MQNRIFILLMLSLSIACSRSNKDQLASDQNNGIIKTYGKDGNLFSEISMEGGKRNGISKNFYKNGKVSLEVQYKNDIKDGFFKQYYEDGTLSKNFEYKNDSLNGISKKLRQDGTPAWEARFEKDEPCTGLVEYYLNGALKTEYPFIIIQTEDRLRETGEYTVYMRLSNDGKPVRFYKGRLSESGCFYKERAEEIYPDNKGKFKLRYYLGPGEFLMEEIHLVAVLKTPQGNSYITTKGYNLAITN